MSRTFDGGFNWKSDGLAINCKIKVLFHYCNAFLDYGLTIKIPQ